MHVSNVFTSWTLAAAQALQGAAGASGVTGRELAALTLVGSHPGCSLEWLRRRVGLTQSGSVRMVDRLEERALMRRRRRGRAVALELTRAGRRTLARWHASRELAVAELLDPLTRNERDALITAMAAGLQRSRRPRLAADAACRGCDWDACGRDCPVDLSVVDEE